MLDLTSYRRKQKYIKPITVMRQLFHSYSKSISSKQYAKNQKDPLIKKTLSLQKFDRYFNQLHSPNQRQSTITLSNPRNDQKQFRTKLFNNSSISKYPLEYSKQNQTNSFQSQLSKNCGIFRVHPYIKMMHSSNNSQKDEKQTNDHPPLFFFNNRVKKMRNPTPLYLQICELKQQNEKKSSTCRKKLRKIRQNWILNNLYHHTSQQGSKQRIPQKITLKFKQREMFQQTKQNIFPTGRTNY